MKETKPAINGCNKSIDCKSADKISNNTKLREATIIGIDKSIENIAAESLLIFKNLAPVIVTPALLAPGIKAKT